MRRSKRLQDVPTTTPDTEDGAPRGANVATFLGPKHKGQDIIALSVSTLSHHIVAQKTAGQDSYVFAVKQHKS